MFTTHLHLIDHLLNVDYPFSHMHADTRLYIGYNLPMLRVGFYNKLYILTTCCHIDFVLIIKPPCLTYRSSLTTHLTYRLLSLCSLSVLTYSLSSLS